MDIEHLNKTQIILLTLLVSFVTSIATGIATVSLIEKAPTDVTRVIDRIVEQPIETVVSGGKEIVTQTVVVQESELIAKAIATIRPSVVRVYQDDRNGRTFLAFGIVTDTQGTILTDASVVKEKRRYVVVVDGGTELNVTAGSTSNDLIALSIDATQKNNIPSFTPAQQAVFDNLVLGQTVVALGGSSAYTVAPGVITEITNAASDARGRGSVRTTISSSTAIPGSPLVTSNGEIIGTPVLGDPGLFRALISQAGSAQ
jgi:hypothetical protein